MTVNHKVAHVLHKSEGACHLAYLTVTGVDLRFFHTMHGPVALSLLVISVLVLIFKDGDAA